MITEKTFTMHFWQVIFTGAGYVVESNKEHGEGRSDVIVYDSENGQLAFLKWNIPARLTRWNNPAKKHLPRSMKKCMQKNLRIPMIKFCVMELLFLRNAAWYIWKIELVNGTTFDLDKKRTPPPQTSLKWRSPLISSYQLNDSDLNWMSNHIGRKKRISQSTSLFTAPWQITCFSFFKF